MQTLKEKRIFVAFNLSVEAKKVVDECINSLSTIIQGVKWVKSGQAHVTLHFIGNINEDKINTIIKKFENYESKIGQLIFRIDSINAFPNINNPRVIFLQCEQINGNGAEILYRKTKNDLLEMDIDLEVRPYKSHITLGRIKNDRKIEIKNRIKFKKPFEFNIETFELMESVLKPEGPEYKIIKSFKL